MKSIHSAPSRRSKVEANYDYYTVLQRATQTKKVLGKIDDRKKNVDEMTGLSFDFGERGTARSDVTYDTSTKFVQNILSDSGSTRDFRIEFELSPKYLLVTTASSDDASGEEYYQRGIFVGELTFRKGRLTKAKLVGGGADNINLKDGVVTYEDAYIQQFDNPIILKDFKSNSTWQILEQVIDDTIIYSASYSNNPPSDPLMQTGDFGKIREYAGGEIFEANWWQDPFTPNLI